MLTIRTLLCSYIVSGVGKFGNNILNLKLNSYIFGYRYWNNTSSCLLIGKYPRKRFLVRRTFKNSCGIISKKPFAKETDKLTLNNRPIAAMAHYQQDGWGPNYQNQSQQYHGGRGHHPENYDNHYYAEGSDQNYPQHGSGHGAPRGNSSYGRGQGNQRGGRNQGYSNNSGYQDRSGLSRMKRNHIHFAPGEPKSDGVISGQQLSFDKWPSKVVSPGTSASKVVSPEALAEETDHKRKSKKNMKKKNKDKESTVGEGKKSRQDSTSDKHEAEGNQAQLPAECPENSVDDNVTFAEGEPACKPVVSRQFGTKATAGPYRVARPLLLGTLAAGAGIYLAKKRYGDNISSVVQSAVSPIQSVSAAGPPESQPSVFSQGKDHALYLWIHLKPTANAKEIAKSVAKLQKYVDQVSDPSLRDDEDEVWAGVGFGPNFYSQVTGKKTRQNYTYPYRKGALGEMPSTGGDVFIHAKSNQVSKLFELAQVILKNIPAESIENFEDIYSFVFRNGRDLSGFIDGTENPADDEDRSAVAVEKETGGSYVITQKWIHRMNVINSEKDKTLEGWLGRSREDSIEQSRKTITSHVARMTGGSGFNLPKPVQIVRQSMPFGTLGKECGLFFIGYAASPANFEFMLDQMVGAGGDGQSDDVMRLSKNVKGTYWYFPGVAELKKLE